MQRYVVGLQCLRCGSERDHAVTYLGNVIACIACLRCGATVAPQPEVLRERYLRDLELRLVDKPGRMLAHARQRPVEFFLHYLPLGLIRKPGEILREWEVLARAASARSPRGSPCGRGVPAATGRR